jgi:hypothetical protein
LVIAIFSALTALLRLSAILTRGTDTLDVVMLLTNAATAAGAALFAFRGARR